MTAISWAVRRALLRGFFDNGQNGKFLRLQQISAIAMKLVMLDEPRGPPSFGVTARTLIGKTSARLSMRDRRNDRG